jgi:hypothetical protein
MFAVVQFPLTDVRPLLDTATRRVERPGWPLVNLPDDSYRAPFVRGFGRARRRQQGGVEEWPAEDAYCDGSNAVRFSQGVLKGDPVATGRLRRFCAFRRLYWDGQLKDKGSIVGRFEVGFGLRLIEGKAPLSGDEVGRIVDSLLAETVSVVATPSAGQPAPKPTALGNAGPAIARACLQSTTHSDSLAALDEQRWWLQSSTPIVILEYVRDEEVETLPTKTRPVALSGAPFGGIRVFLGRRIREGRERPVWFFERETQTAGKDASRRLRINVTRLHASMASLRVLSDLRQQKRIVSATPGSDLEQVLNKYLPFLYQTKYQGFPWTDFLTAAVTLDEAMTPNDIATLRALNPELGRGLQDQIALASSTADRTRATDEPIEWDIFVAHANADKPIALQLADLLKDRARVFVDATGVAKGEEWDVVIPRAQRRSLMTVVLVGPTGDTAYYLRSEVQTAIGLSRLEDHVHRVLPVYLPGIERQFAPYGLNLKQGIDLKALDDLAAVADQLVAALEAAKARQTTGAEGTDVAAR